MSAQYILKVAEQMAGAWPTQMPGHVSFGAEALDVDGDLPDGVHRLEGSAWQFVVEAGRIVRAIREDMKAWWDAEYSKHEASENPGSDDG